MRALLTLEFDSVAELADYLIQPAGPVIPAPSLAPAPDGQKEEAPAKPRGRPRKAADTTPAASEKVSTQSEPTVQVNPAFNPEVTPAVTPEVAPAAPAETPAEGLKWAATFDGSRSALREVFNIKGAGVATELLKQFNAARISDVKPADYANFVTAASKSLT